MLTYGEALEKLRAAARPRAISDRDSVQLKDAIGRVSAEDVSSPCAIPPFDNSAMDGFALVASGGLSPGDTLPILGIIRAGDSPSQAVEKGAWRIMTGAPLPQGCDAVVPVERTKTLGGETGVQLLDAVSAGDFVRSRGADFAQGARLFPAGTRLGPRHLLACAAAGVERISVVRKPRVALLATGSELASVGQSLQGGMIRDANSTYVGAALSDWGASFSSFGVVRDEPALFRSVFIKAMAENFDLVLTTGAVSMGDADFIPQALAALGAEVVFHKAAVRPGKPILLARFSRGPIVIGLPGNPISTVSGLRFFVEPCLREMLSRPPEIAERARLTADVTKPETLRCFFRARRVGAGQVEVLEAQASFQIHSLLQSDLWAILPEGRARYERGEELDVVSLLEIPS